MQVVAAVVGKSEVRITLRDAAEVTRFGASFRDAAEAVLAVMSDAPSWLDVAVISSDFGVRYGSVATST